MEKRKYLFLWYFLPLKMNIKTVYHLQGIVNTHETVNRVNFYFLVYGSFSDIKECISSSSLVMALNFQNIININIENFWKKSKTWTLFLSNQKFHKTTEGIGIWYWRSTFPELFPWNLEEI